MSPSIHTNMRDVTKNTLDKGRRMQCVSTYTPPNQRFRPHFFQAFRSEPIGRKRILPQKNFNLGEVTHLPPCIVATGGKAAPCRICVCGYAFLQIVARLRHAVICHDRRFRPHFFQAFRSESIGRKRVTPPKISTSERLYICHPASSRQVARLRHAGFLCVGTHFYK